MAELCRNWAEGNAGAEGTRDGCGQFRSASGARCRADRPAALPRTSFAAALSQHGCATKQGGFAPTTVKNATCSNTLRWSTLVVRHGDIARSYNAPDRCTNTITTEARDNARASSMHNSGHTRKQRRRRRRGCTWALSCLTGLHCCCRAQYPRIRRIHHQFGRSGAFDAISGCPLPSPWISAKVLG